MPFTPSLLDTTAERYLVNEKAIRFPYMTIACPTTPQGREHLVAALHPADYTARPQIVTRDYNPGYWDVINEFYSITGIGGLLNTSLNLSGLPICESPEDVFDVLLNSDLDMVVLGTTLVLRADLHTDVTGLMAL